MHKENEPHVTEHYDLRNVTPKMMMQTFRIKPEKADPSEENRAKIDKLLERWLIRRADRHGYTFANHWYGPVGGNEEGGIADAMVLLWWEVDTIPEDWLCFSGMIWDAVFGPRMPQMRVLDLGGLFGLAGPGEPSDTAEMEVGGETVTIGTQKRVKH